MEHTKACATIHLLWSAPIKSLGKKICKLLSPLKLNSISLPLHCNKNLTSFKIISCAEDDLLGEEDHEEDSTSYSDEQAMKLLELEQEEEEETPRVETEPMDTSETTGKVLKKLVTALGIIGSASSGGSNDTQLSDLEASQQASDAEIGVAAAAAAAAAEAAKGASNVKTVPEKETVVDSAKIHDVKFPPIYHTTKNKRDTAIKTRVLGGGGGEDPLVKGLLGSFSSDSRFSHTHHRHNYDTGTNYSFSFDPVTMHCQHCEHQHPVLEREGSTDGCGLRPRCFLLSDQCFPPSLPSGGGGGLPRYHSDRGRCPDGAVCGIPGTGQGA